MDQGHSVARLKLRKGWSTRGPRRVGHLRKETLGHGARFEREKSGVKPYLMARRALSSTAEIGIQIFFRIKALVESAGSELVEGRSVGVEIA